MGSVYDIGKFKFALFPGYLRVEDHLKEQISQLFLEFLRIIHVQGIQYLVRFFDQHRFQGLAGLLPVPRASVFTSESGYEVD